jgi:Uma2 family endonuclease
MSHIPSFTDNHLPPHLLVNVKDVISPEQFEELCRVNRDLRLELTSTGELIAMPPTGSRTGISNANLTYQLVAWVEREGSGVAFDSSTGFALPNNARFSPDAAWIKRERWDALTEIEQDGFAPLCPDFVIEIRSRSDNLPPLESKMQEYIANGALLGWLIDPLKRRVYIYAPDREVVILENPAIVSGGSLLPGFELRTSQLW